MKSTLRFAVSVVLLVCLLTINASAAQAQSWYCVRNKEHKQPRLDASMSYIEQYNGYYIDRKHFDDCEEKVVYLTFDAGYENGNVAKILDVMKSRNVKGAFFILGNLVTKNTDLVLRMADEGHLVCNHTNIHSDMTTKTTIEDFKAELEALEVLYRERTGRELSRYFRPPEGRFNEPTLRFASELGYKTVFWSFAYADWDNNKQMSAVSAKQKILENMHNGAVILLHPTSATNAEILGDVIDTLISEGYRFGTLDELTA